MKKAFLAFLFVFLLACSAFFLLLALIYAKEGSSWSEVPTFVGVVFAGLVLAIVWWLCVGRSFKWALLGWAVLLPTVFAHSWMAVALMFARYEGDRLARTARIENYSEKPITWQGFDGPVGIEITLELHHATGLDAAILPPEIRMGADLDIPRDRLSATRTNGSGYFKDTYLERKVGDLTILKTVLFQKIFENPSAKNQHYKWNAFTAFDTSGTTRLVYHLLPGAVDYVPDRNRICIDSRSHGVPLCTAGEKPANGCASPNVRRITQPIYTDGQHLSSIWLGVGAYDMTADMSRQLTAALRRHSSLQSNPDAWTSMQKRLEPAGLAQAGYELCPAGDNSHTSARTCYCKPE